MTNNCLELVVTKPEPMSECSETQPCEGGHRLADRFEVGLAQCKVEAECLNNALWEELPGREKVARLLCSMGFQSKATRFRDCHATGIPVDCLTCGEKYFSRYRCTLRYCEYCGPWHFSRLMEKYYEPITSLIESQPSHRGRTLAKLNFTIRAYDRIPDPSEARRLLKLVRRWFYGIMRKGSHGVWGCIFAVETGHELTVKHPGRKAGGWNLHIHVLYYGPFLDWAAGLRFWTELTNGDGQGFYIKQCPGWRRNPKQAVRRALTHHFGYVLKPAAVSAERIAALEVLFSGIRRVRALGCFYRLPQPKQAVVNACCPKCGQNLPVNLRAWHRSARFPVGDLEAQGRRDFREIEREIRRARVFGGNSP